MVMTTNTPECCLKITLQQWSQGRGWQKCNTESRQFHNNSDSLRRLISKDSIVCIIVVNSNQLYSCPRCQQSFTKDFHIPPSQWRRYCTNSNGYFGCELTGADNSLEINSWVRFEVKQVYDGQRYHWHKIAVFTRWQCQSKRMEVLVFDDDPLFSELMLKNPPAIDAALDAIPDPFWFYTHLLEEVCSLQEKAVWSIRDQVRLIEKQRQPIGKPQPDYQHMHDLARHAIHVQETLDVSTQTLAHIIKRHEDLMNLPDVLKPNCQETHFCLQFFESIIGSLRCRSVSNKERLLNEIQLAFNTVAQYDAGTSVEIGRAAQSDSAAMKTIAFVTMAFLPPTFISAIFSMSFFSYNDAGDWIVSDKFWIYWAFSAPITLLAFAVWYMWQHQFPTWKSSNGVWPAC